MLLLTGALGVDLHLQPKPIGAGGQGLLDRSTAAKHGLGKACCGVIETTER